jgi:hypothetical protein
MGCLANNRVAISYLSFRRRGRADVVQAQGLAPYFDPT